MTPKQERFALLYAKGLDGVQAYSEAYGIEPATRAKRRQLAARACELRKRADVLARIEEVQRADRMDTPKPRLALLLGNSAADSSIAADAFAIYAPVSTPANIEAGTSVVVRKSGGRDVAVMQVERRNGTVLRLTPHSTSPHCAAEALTLDLSSPEGDEIVGLVLGKYTPL